MCMPGESNHRRLWSLLLYLCYLFWALINSLVCWSHTEQWLFDMDNQVLQTKLLEPNSHKTVTLHCGQPCFTYTIGAKLTQNSDSSPWPTVLHIQHPWSQTHTKPWLFTVDNHVLHTLMEPSSHFTVDNHVLHTLVEPNSHFTKDNHVLHTLVEPSSHFTKLHTQPCFTYTSGAKLTLHQGQPCFTYTSGAKLTLHQGQPCFTYASGAKLTLHCGQPCFTYTSGAKLTLHCGQPCFTYASGAKLTLHQGQPCFTYTSGAKLTLHQGQPCFTYNTIGAKLRTLSENRQTRERNVCHVISLCILEHFPHGLTVTAIWALTPSHFSQFVHLYQCCFQLNIYSTLSFKLLHKGVQCIRNAFIDYYWQYYTQKHLQHFQLRTPI